jgi:hypothetical protein
MIAAAPVIGTPFFVVCPATAGSAVCCRPSSSPASATCTTPAVPGVMMPVVGTLFIRETKDVDIYARD